MKMTQLQKIVNPLLDWYKLNHRDLPWRKSKDPYSVWISEIMLQQTRVEAVIPYYLRFMERFPDVRALAGCDEEELMKYWEGLGYYSRARNLKKAAGIICAEYDGKFPEKYEQVRSLPGIGPYTSGAICSIALGLPKAAVDGNVLRVVARLTECDRDIMEQSFRREMEEALEKVYPREESGLFTQSLMELGAIVCVPNGAPKCEKCPLKEMCGASSHSTQADFPVKKKKAERKIEEKTVLLLRYDGNIAIHRRDKGGLLAGLWEFPNLLGHLQLQEVMDYLGEHGIQAGEALEQKAQKHIFSHIEWHMQCYEITCKSVKSILPNEDFIWVLEEELEKKYALPTAFRKLYERNDTGD